MRLTFSPIFALSVVVSALAGCGGDASGPGPADQGGGSGPVTAGATGVPGAGQSAGGAVQVGGAGAPDSGAASGGDATTGGSASGGAPAAGGSSGRGGASNGGGKATGGGGATVGSGGAFSGSCAVSPVDPDATPQAKKLLCYLYSVYGNHVLSGQQETSWSNPANDISFYTGNASIGKAPAILGGDFMYTTANGTTTTSRAQAYWAAGGISMIRYHMGAPPNSDSYANSMLGYSSAQCVNVITSGTAENTSFISKLNTIAGNLQTLQTAGVPVLLALFHETQQGGWFWWSKCSSSQFIALYTYTYNYLMTTKGIHNIVRLMPYSGSPTASFFPGKALVDITGGDTYGSNIPFTGLFSNCRNIGGTMPLTLHETGIIPQPTAMFPSAAPWLLWNVWAGYESSKNPIANIISAYSSPFTITRDEIPNLK